MWSFRVFFIVMLQTALFASWDDYFPDSDMVYKNVNLLSGQLTLNFCDLTVHGVQPLMLTRSYSSSSFEKQWPKPRAIDGGYWYFYPHVDMRLLWAYDSKPGSISLAEPSGEIIHYTFHKRLKKDHFLFMPTKTASLHVNGELSARTDPRNNQLELNMREMTATVMLPTGGKRLYRGRKAIIKHDNLLSAHFYLRSEHTSSGVTLYEYHKDHHLKRISTHDPSGERCYASIEFDAPCSDDIKVRASGNREVAYRCVQKDGQRYLVHVIPNFSTPLTFSPAPSRKGKRFRVNEIWTGNSLELNIKYHVPQTIKEGRHLFKHPETATFELDRVRSIEGPVGEDGELMSIATFDYEEGETKVHNGLNRRTTYRYNQKNGQVQSIAFYDANNTLYSTQQFYWQEDRLFCKALFDEHKNITLFAKTFAYDPVGNVLEESLWGQFTGMGKSSIALSCEGRPLSGEVYRKRYDYLPEFNVPIRQEEDNGFVQLFRYKPGTDLLEACYTCDGSKILSRAFFIYDEANVLIGEISDDGEEMDPNNLCSVTRRIRKDYLLDPRIFLPSEIKESYWDGHTYRPLSTRRCHYSDTHQLVREEVYDATENLRYTLETDYDTAGRVVRTTDPLGQESRYEFDAHGRLCESREAGSPLYKKIHYNGASCPHYIEEVDSDQNRRCSGTYYDVEGRITKTVDAFGNATTFVLDAFGRVLETHFPQTLDEQGRAYTPTIRTQYNAQGDIISISDERGRTTSTTYNTYRKPLRIDSPDGGILRHEYHLCGTVAKTIQPDGTEERYEYNVLHKQTSKKIYSPTGELLSEENWGYKGDILLSYTSPTGLTTHYEYDGAGKKMAETTEGRIIHFSYDSMGFLSEIFDVSTGVKQCFVRDVVGKVLHEWTEQPDSKREHEFYYEYDKYQRKSIITRIVDSQRTATDLIWYDDQGRVVKHTDPLHHTTHIEYNEHVRNELYQFVLQKTTTDALGHFTVELFDALGHLVRVEKKDPLASLVARSQFFYNRVGDKVKEVTTVFIRDKQVRETTSTYAYDAKKRLIQSIEAGIRSHAFSFDTKGRLMCRQKPNGTKIFHSYDGLDRLTQLQSSDGSIHLEFHYGKGRGATEIMDLVQHTSVHRSYDTRGNLLSDQQLHFEYDAANRCKQLHLPDGSAIHYSYQGSHLQQVTRQDASQRALYAHRYASFDRSGRIEEEEPICALGTVRTKYDLLGRPIEQTSPPLSLTAHYDEIGRLDQTYNSLHGNNEYQYDGLSQLTAEREKTYCFDSIGNPAASGYEVNDLNELLKTPFCNITYDLNGNPLQRMENGRLTNYRFDALDRLIEISTSERIVRYRYDGLSRLNVKETLILQNGLWQSENQRTFLYDDQMEIGALDEHGSIVQLKILGLGIQGDIGSAVAIELDGIPYAPLHDFRGNILAIVSSANAIVESYDLSAFGEGTPSNCINPWRFSSKRSDEGLIYFGKRFYDPSMQRWLSPDPAGRIDGPNLYAYVWNNPTNRLDELGLYGLDFKFGSPPSGPMSTSVPTAGYNFPSPPPHPDLYRGQCFDIHCSTLRFGDYVLQFSPEPMPSFNTHLRTIFAKTDWPSVLKGNELSPIVVFAMLVNGINVPREELFGSAQKMYAMLGGSCPTTGFHNASHGLPSDWNRIKLEFDRKDTISVVGLRQVLCEAMDYFASVCPNFLLFLVGHSEGGLIIYNAIRGMDETHCAMARKHLMIRTYGSIQFIPDDYGSNVNNTCSEKDSAASYARGKYASCGSVPNGCTVTEVPCISSLLERSWPGGPDHNFGEPTYLKALRDDIDRVRDRHVFIYSKNR